MSINAILFPHGRILATPGAVELCAENGLDMTVYLARHLSGDWGDLCDEDKALNSAAVFGRGRILSAYETEYGRLWIITEADRSATTLLLPEEY